MAPGEYQRGDIVHVKGGDGMPDGVYTIVEVSGADLMVVRGERADNDVPPPGMWGWDWAVHHRSASLLRARPVPLPPPPPRDECPRCDMPSAGAVLCDECAAEFARGEAE